MTATESRDLKIGSRVCWQGKADDGGKIAGTSWNAVTIAWDNDMCPAFSTKTCEKFSER